MDPELREQLAVPGCVRAAGYDPLWIVENAMGPNPLWLVETLVEAITIEPGMRVLDLGCGRAITSVFLARELGARVWAVDLWIDPTDNWRRIREAGAGDKVCPVKAEAHALPFAEEFFDAIVCIDAYEYFGTDDRYIAELSRFLRPGGQVGVSVPATVTELDGEVPEHLREGWDWEFHAWHSPGWWRRQWTKTGHVQVERAELLPDGWAHWQRWEEAMTALGRASGGLAGMLAADAGRTLGFARLVARRR
ncbi:MAG TPA: methyltransferase domain-containing protein [Actinomycetota bacterium]|nr:methyltransferase domain-containing protein [Actinomycetota bacterium]